MCVAFGTEPLPFLHYQPLTDMIFDENNDTIYCRFAGNLNTTTCAEVSSALSEHVDSALTRILDIKVVFDLANTHYVASSFVRLCVLYCKKVGKDRFRVENASVEIRNVFDIVGLTDLLG